MLRYLPLVIQIGLLVYALIDSIQTPEDRIKHLPKFAWILLIVLVPFAGPLGWLIAGRQSRRPGKSPATTYQQPPPRPLAPDDDPEFLNSLRQGNLEHEQMLQQWEQNLRRREKELRDNQSEDVDPDSPTAR